MIAFLVVSQYLDFVIGVWCRRGAVSYIADVIAWYYCCIRVVVALSLLLVVVIVACFSAGVQVVVTLLIP